MPYDIPLEEEKRLRAMIKEVLDAAEPVVDLKQMEMFSPEERLISRWLWRMLYEPRLPFGDYHAKKNIHLLKKLIRKKELTEKANAIAHKAIASWEQVVGWYYQCKPLTAKSNAQDFRDFKALQKQAEENKQWECWLFTQMVLNGLPEPVANFEVKPLFILVRIDGRRDRMLRIFNSNGEDTGIVSLDSESYSQPSKLRVWLSNQGNLAWMTGERDLNALQADMAHHLKRLEVYQVPAFGWHEQSRLWFFGDCALGSLERNADIPAGASSLQTQELADKNVGVTLRPDKDGVIWKNDVGYTILDKGSENQEWRLPKPRMHPEIGGVKASERRSVGASERNAPTLGRSDALTTFEVSDERNVEALSAFFREFANRLRASLQTADWAGYDAFLLIGATLAFVAAPELFARYKMFPGMWIHGQTHTGKSTLAQLLVEIYGFHGMSQGLGLQKNISAVGMQIAAEQFSNLPIWLDEYSNAHVEEDKMAIIHSSFNRELTSKWSADGKMRKLRTNFIITGEHTTSKASTRARYVHCQTAKSDWSQSTNQLTWMEQHRHLFFLFGREVLLRRGEYIEHLSRAYDSWKSSQALIDLQERARLTYGIAYSGFAAMVAMLETHLPQEMHEFKAFTMKHSLESAEHIAAEVNINKFWDDLISAFGEKEIDLDYFKIKVFPYAGVPGRPNQGTWAKYYLFLEPKGICSQMRIYLRKQGRNMPLEPGDVRDQMAKDEMGYWVPGQHNQRFGKKVGQHKCWCIDLDKHPMGYWMVSDEVYEGARNEREPSSFGMDAFRDGDPRKGPLYGIVDALEQVKRGER